MSSIDYGTLALGALVGVGCRKQLKSAAKVAATTVASLTSSVAVAVNSAAAEMYEKSEETQANGQSAQGQNGQNG